MEDRIVLEFLVKSAQSNGSHGSLTRRGQGPPLTEVMRSNMLIQIRRDLKSTNAFRTACSGSSIKEPATIVRRLVGLLIVDKSLDVG